MSQDGAQDADAESVARLRAEIEELRLRLGEAEETIRAIRHGEVDAFVVAAGADADAEDDRVITLETAEHPYRRLVEAMHQAALTVAADGTILYANRAFARAVLRPSEAILGRPVGDLIAEAGRPTLAEVLARGAGARGEVLLLRGDGESLPVRVATGEPAGEGVACLIITDLTDQRRLAEVVAAETLSRSILEQAVDAIVVGDPGGTLIRAGVAVRRLCGRDPRGLGFDEAFPLIRRGGAAGSPFVLPISRVISGETVRGVEVSLTAAEGARGRDLDLLLSVGPLKDVEGIVVGFVATLTDVTELRRAEEALREADRRKDEFLATLAHELRNPLSAIANAARVARLAPDEASGRGWALDVVDRQGRQLAHLVDDLLDVSRISLGKIELRKEALDARVVVERAAQAVRPQLAAKSQALDLALDEGPLPVDADPTRLEQVLVNLLANASKYTDASGRIAIVARAEGGRATLRVEDDGIGIAPGDLGRIFELFGQVDDSIARSHGGLGIGLTLVRRLVELHGGDVAAESAGLGRGSAFTVRLPLAREAAEAPAPAVAAPPSRPPAGGRILLVDDNVDGVSGLARLLRERGFDVRTAHDGPAALAAAEADLPAVAVLDIGLPGMDGYELAARLRGRFGGRVALYAVSGYGREEDVRRAKQAGFDGYLVKPVDVDMLLQSLPTAAAPRAGR
ncbi:PAS domain-containing hybrid sensor histidine kinase/response regulator [Paludisphaera mucosa]|uniref:histidine kinase n=1 Tax=Paludisphaera mucosa TaxID=3030827 RepID=A0ABT6FL06_9BACT|nr:ATP-binding protein [Paludisphaera mucosa]MDG3008199.1 ATP-binding protein [Paludisphaera mucosa]